ncbi:MAG: hypothetical protein J7604_22690 [Sporocytophaga sp.]|uniref:hypothetical protein n=1 Tax=Sporocytophaga sp. TaxID=2231183 RepID=UPI001B2B33BB|nr:hypothetical protein [Sporocytophaga sp.]MBO9703040.1 hypothetical protein [Sporocytophaga sp.]
MKKILSTVIFSAFIAFTSFAQNQGQHQGHQHNGGGHEQKTPEERAEAHAQRLTKELSLTADQTGQVKTIILTQEQKAEEIRAKYKTATDKKAEHQEMEALKTSSEGEIEKILTADQLTKYKELKNKQHNHGSPNNGKGQKHNK